MVSVYAQQPNESAEALVEAGKLFASGNFAGVIETLAPLAEKFPNLAEVQHGLGLAFYQQQKFAEAIQHLSLSLKNEQEDSNAWRQTVEILGMSRYYNHDWREAVPLLARANSWSPHNDTLLYALAMSYLYSHDRENARGTFARLFGVPPDSSRALMLAADLMYQEELADDAELLYLEVRKQWPETPDVQFKLGLVALTRRDYAAVVEHMKAELTRDPVHPLAWQFLGDALFKAGKTSEAIDALQRAIWLNGRSAKLFVMLAQAYLEQGQLAIAESSLSHALALEPQNYEANFLLAKLYFKTNRPDLAKQRMSVAESLRKAAAAVK